MLKKLAVFVILMVSMSITVFAAPQISAEKAAVMVAGTNELIYGKNEHSRATMASTTKIMTSLIVLEQAQPEKEITVTKDMITVEGTSMGLMAGDRVTMKTLVKGMLLQSGNDGANAAAIAVSGTVEKFAELMNRRAQLIGMNDTHFVTPSGLDAEGHYSTAYDMALLGCEAIMNPEFRAICSLKSSAVYYGNPPYRRVLSNHNSLLSRYPDTIGIKTGFTKSSGRCLVSAAERNGVTLVAVTLNAPDDWNDHIALLNYGFSKVTAKKLTFDVSDIRLKIFGGTAENLPVETADEPIGALTDTDGFFSYKVSLKPYEYAPVKAGKIVGTVQFFHNKKYIGETALLAAQDIGIKPTSDKSSGNKKSLIQKILEFLHIK
ncbi:MAG: D-alanyl-D-alanine carboxypeptidase [Clostridiales bacterium]|nr:D-alanyl-D-alanine carboxypeptidase [Clostridiales bacterium]